MVVKYQWIIYLLVVIVFTSSCETKESKEVKVKKSVTLFNDSLVHEIRVSFPQEFFEDSLVNNRLVKRNGKRAYLQCNVSVDGLLYYASGIKFKGESSYDFYPGKKKSFRIKFNEFVNGQKHEGLSGINVNNNFHDPTMMREHIALGLSRDIDLPTQRSSYTKLYFNNVYYGVYSILELIDGGFLKENFGTKKGSFYYGEPLPDLTFLGDDSTKYQNKYKLKRGTKSYQDLIGLIKEINSGEKLGEKIELDELLKTFAFSNIVANVDAYNMCYVHNFFLFKPKRKTKFSWINYDYNYSYGAWTPIFTYNDLVELDPLYHEVDGEERPLWTLIVSNEILKKRYLELYQEIYPKVLDLTLLSKRMGDFSSLLKESVKKDTMFMYSVDQFEENQTALIGDRNDPGAFMPGILDFSKDRLTFLNQYFKQ